MQTPGVARERLVSDSYVPHPDVDPLGYGELLLGAESAHQRHRAETARSGQARPAWPQMPQSLAHLAAWTADAQQQGLIDADERQVLDDHARYGAEVVKVDDFAAEFGMLEGLQQRKEALEKAMQLAA